MFGGIVALEKQLIKVRSEASDTRLDIADVIQSIDVLPALKSVAHYNLEKSKHYFCGLRDSSVTFYLEEVEATPRNQLYYLGFPSLGVLDFLFSYGLFCVAISILSKPCPRSDDKRSRQLCSTIKQIHFLNLTLHKNFDLRFNL